jgi:non-ribosomal peptide synthetase component F
MADQLRARFDPRRIRLDLRQAPLMRCVVTHDAANGRWLLLWLNHHLTGDHTTLEIMIEETQANLLGKNYRAPEPLPFRNFVAQTRLGSKRAEAEAFFREMLGDVEEPTAPFGLLEAQGDGSEIEEARMELDATLSRRLRERARAMGVSAASLCHVAWARVLARVSGREDVVFGTVLFGRMGGGEGADRVLGLFINTLPIRIRVGSESVERRVRQTQALLGDLLRHEHASLALAQRCSGVAAPTPLFSCLLNYRHSPRQAKQLPEAAQAWAGIEALEAEDRTNYPLMLSVDDLGEGFGLSAQAVSLIEPARICDYMVTALERLVEALESAPETEARAIDALPEAERRQVLEEWNATEAEYPAAGSRQEKLVHELFEEQVEKSPEAVALRYEDGQLSYRELNRKANLLAQHLRELGVGPEVLVGLYLERSPEMVVGIWAVLKAGGAYLPLDPNYPTERLAYMLADAQAPVALTEGRIADRLPVSWTQLVLIDEWEREATGPGSEVELLGVAENSAYVIYTSGSSGRPKGVWITHRGLSNYLRWARETYAAGDGAVVSSSLSFDATVTSLLAPLISGGAVRLLPEGSEIDGLEDY